MVASNQSWKFFQRHRGYTFLVTVGVHPTLINGRRCAYVDKSSCRLEDETWLPCADPATHRKCDMGPVRTLNDGTRHKRLTTGKYSAGSVFPPPVFIKSGGGSILKDKVLWMVSGMEGADAVVEFARKWGIKVKGIKSSEVLVLGASDNYHGVGSGIWRIMKDIGDLVPQGSTTGYLDAVAHTITAIGALTSFAFILVLLFVSDDINSIITSGNGPLLQVLLDATYEQGRSNLLVIVFLPNGSDSLSFVCWWVSWHDHLQPRDIRSWQSIIHFSRQRFCECLLTVLEEDTPTLGTPLDALGLTAVLTLCYYGVTVIGIAPTISTAHWLVRGRKAILPAGALSRGGHYYRP
ncbi:hypothetical protein IFM53868_01412 [Aspergillus udagawae]|uniref:Uncharacterized protein n=1 Tax=Aspergillus udagawae TaxID=91492 RepID=A0ABQ1A9Y1_9EURO|nr:hypothetical protein IFM53868_01412 [Aspergillus udagawae]